MKKIISLLLSFVIVCSCFSCLAITNISAASSVIESALSWALSIANDDSHGYVYGASHGAEGQHYDCSSFVSWALRHAGLNVPISTTHYMVSNFKPYGFEWISWSSIGGTQNLKRGDILLDESAHVEFYYGNNQILGAHNPNRGISVMNYYNNYNGVVWDGVLRYNGSDPEKELISDSKYTPYLPLKTYLNENATAYPYYKDCSTVMSGSEIWATDECTITNVYTNGWCEVNYPASGTTKTGYLPMTKFFCTSSSSLTSKTAGQKMDTFSRADMSSPIGNIDPGDVCYIVGTSGSSTQSIYPTPSGYKMGWTKWITPGPMPGPDERFNPYCPIKSQILGYEDIIVYESDFSTVKPNSEIWTTDDCTITYVYNNGWCEVNYPAGNTTKTAYTPLSSFVQDTSATPERYVATSQVYTYTKTNMSTQYGWLSAGDEFFVVSKSGDLAQVLYPIDAQYGGGYKLGWIYSSQIPKVTYTVSYNANGGSGAPGSQTKIKDVSLTLSLSKPTRDGYTFAGWAESSDATTAKYSAGGTYTTNASITLYAVWSPNKYEILYDLNGGYANITGQVKAHGTNINISEVIPEKIYTIYFSAYEDEVENNTKSVQCEFLGWNTSKTATTASYQPGAAFTTNANVTLYAIWSNPVVGALDTPTKDGYEFLGWYTQETGGTKITENTIISEDTTVYAHWKSNSTPTPSTYTITYNANGGTNAPASQTKTEDVNLVLTKSIPVWEGYTFKGWATSASSQTVAYKAGATYTANANATLYAVWEKNIDINAPAFVISDVSAKAGSTVTVDISIKNNPGITAFNFSVDYLEEVMALTGVEYKTLFSSKASGSKTMTNPFIVSWFSTLSEDETANGVIATLTFKVNEDVEAGSYPINLTYDENNVFDSSFTNIAFAVDNGNVVVTDYVPGDVNGDTVVNMKDIVLLQQYLNDWEVNIDEAAANVNGDTSVNMKDIVLLQQYLNDWDVELK